MACQSPNIREEDNAGLEDNSQKQQLIQHSSTSSESGRSSGYAGSFDLPEDSVFGDVKRRPHQCSCKKGEDDSRQAPLTEADVTEICKHIGRDWKRLGRKLKFLEAKLESISDDKSNHNYEEKAHALLIKFIQEQGSDATKGKLAEAFFSIDRRDLAERLIGSEHFVSKDQQFFFLKNEASLNNIPGEDGKDKQFFTCRSIENGQLYLIRELDGSGYEESCKVLKREDTIADSILKALDVNGIVEAEKQKKERQKFNEVQAKMVELLKGLQEIMDSLENQERKEKRIQVWEQVLEDEKLLGKMQRLGTELRNLTSPVSRLQDRFPLEAQMYSLSLGLSALHRDLEERVRMLSEMVPRGQKLLDEIETEKFDQLLKRSRSVGKQIKMAENGFVKRLQEATSTLENQQRPRHGEDSSTSDPLPKANRYQEDIPEIRRGSSQPGSEKERRTLQEEVAPPPDPMEQDEESLC